MPNTKKQKTVLTLNPDEMAFRKIYWNLLKDQKLKTVFRPGKRVSGTPRAYTLGQIVYAKMIDSIGVDWAGIPPQFVEDLSCTIRITKITAKRIGDLKNTDFSGSSPDVFDRTSLRYHLGAIYNLYASDLEDRAWVTIINFEYVNMEEKIENSQETFKLLNEKILTFAKKPRNNPQALSFGKYALTLIEHDYAGKTPVMWNAVYRAFDISAGSVMLVGDTGNIEKIFAALRKDTRYKGGGAGVGFKDKILPFLDEIDPIAKEIGAVNFIQKTSEGKLRGYNTDGMGYAQSVQNLFDENGKTVSGSKVVVIGAGGTGNAISFMLAKLGMRIVIINRSIEKAEKLSQRINSYLQLEGDLATRFASEDKLVLEVKDADLVVNVSTKGATGAFENYNALAAAEISSEENLSEQLLKKNQQLAEQVYKSIPSSAVLSDIVLRDGDTPFLKRAKELGFKTLDGLPMVVFQGVEAFWLLHANELESKGITKKQVAEIMKTAAGS